MHRIKQSAVDMKLALLKGDMAEFAHIIGQAWEDKKKWQMVLLIRRFKKRLM